MNCGTKLKFFWSRDKMLHILARNLCFQDKGKAEENVYMLKRQHEELVKLKKRMAQQERLLKAKLDQTEDLIKKAERDKDPNKKDNASRPLGPTNDIFQL